MATRFCKAPGKKRFYGKKQGGYAPPANKDAVALAFIEQALKAGKRVSSAGLTTAELQAKLFGGSEPEESA